MKALENVNTGLAGVKKGDNIMILGFTGMRLGLFEVTKSAKTQLAAKKTDGTEMVFDRKTGVQKNVEEGKEKYANIAIKEDEVENLPEQAKRKKRTKKAAPKVEVEEEEVDEDDFEDEEEVATPAPKKKAPAKKKSAPKKKAAPAPVEEDDFEDDFDDDDEFEEI